MCFTTFQPKAAVFAKKRIQSLYCMLLTKHIKTFVKGGGDASFTFDFPYFLHHYVFFSSGLLFPWKPFQNSKLIFIQKFQAKTMNFEFQWSYITRWADRRRPDRSRPGWLEPSCDRSRGRSRRSCSLTIVHHSWGQGPKQHVAASHIRKVRRSCISWHLTGMRARRAALTFEKHADNNYPEPRNDYTSSFRVLSAEFVLSSLHNKENYIVYGKK